ncbi:MAG: ORF6C domain-containing protein, partial [Desulfovibrio sp.]|nr:ORF6C domain-containing protein [Desulfovibrio sp.]
RRPVELLDARPRQRPAPQTAEAAITPDQQCTLQAIVRARVEGIPAERRSKGLYPQIWSCFNNHFRLGSYKQLPQYRMSEAVAYLTRMEIAPALPPQPERLPLYRNGCFYPPHRDRSHVPGPQEAALLELWQDWTRREAGLRQEFMAMLRELDARRGDLFSYAVSDLGMLIPCSARSACWTACSRAARKPNNASAKRWMTPACTCA